MDTKERKQRRPARTPEEAAARRQRSEQQRARRNAVNQDSQRKQPTRRRAGAVGTVDRSGIESGHHSVPRQRTVRRPESEQIPEVIYSMPKPFSRGRFFLKLLTVAAVVLAVMSCLSLFFRVDEILVSGAEKYSPYSIKVASGIEEGDSLLQLSEPRTAGKIIDSLPYIKSVKISRTLPGTVNIQVQELEVTYAIQAIDETWWLIASDGRVIEQIDAAQASSYTKIVGLVTEATRINQPIQVIQMTEPEAQTNTESTDPEQSSEPTTEEDETGNSTQPTAESEQDPSVQTETQAPDEESLNTLLSILGELERNEVIGQMSVIDLSSLTDISMEYGTRFHVILGTTEDLGYKIAAMKSAVEQLQEYEIGELDVSFKLSNKVVFNPTKA